MGPVWHTKYGPRQVRYDPPTLAEAIAAAQGLTDNLQQQAEIAASLMSVEVDEVMSEVIKARPQRRNVDTVAITGRNGVQRAAIVERRIVRRPMIQSRFR
jgi:hypothetical protein